MTGGKQDWEQYRELFPITGEQLFLNHAAVSPASRPVVEAVQRFWNDRLAGASRNYPEWMSKVEGTRNKAARLMGCLPEEIAFTSNTSHGLSAIAAGLRWRAGDVVLVSSPDFPSMQYAWQPLQSKGVQVKPVGRSRTGRFGVREVEQALVPGTRLLAVSSVDYSTGFRADLEALGTFCRERSILFCVDCIQSLGVLDLDMKGLGIHFLAAGGHKWLMGPMGLGILAVDQAVADQLDPVLVGWKSVRNEEDFSFHYELKTDARRFEPGTQNLSGIFALGAAIQLLLDVGITAIEQRVLHLNSLFAAQLSSMGLPVFSSQKEGERSGILVFGVDGDPGDMWLRLMKRKIMVSARGGGIRVAPHFYNTEEEVDRFCSELKELL